MPKRNEKRADKPAVIQRKTATGKPFVKGDPRINRLGRPKTHDELRALIQSISAESTDNKPEWTRVELMVRSMMTSKSAADRANILEHGWGKVPLPVQLDVSAELKRLAEQLGLTPIDITNDPALAVLFGVAGVEVKDEANSQ